jgi:hypothetical protein
MAAAVATMAAAMLLRQWRRRCWCDNGGGDAGATMAAAILALTTIDNYGDDADNAGNDGAVMARLAALRYCVGIWVM